MKALLPNGTRPGQKPFLLGDNGFVVAGLAGVIVCVWVYLLRTSFDMYGRMEGPAAWMMEARWDPSYILLIFVMWTTMMVGMMLPSALPTILLFRRAIYRDSHRHSP